VTTERFKKAKRQDRKMLEVGCGVFSELVKDREQVINQG